MSKISSDMLSNTLNLLALARQTALAKGNQEQAEKVAPVENKLRELVTETRQHTSPEPVSTVMGQSDFQKLLAIKQNVPAERNETASVLDRNQVISAMASGGMGDMDIARQMGVSQEEVQLVLSIGRRQIK